MSTHALRRALVIAAPLVGLLGPPNGAWAATPPVSVASGRPGVGALGTRLMIRLPLTNQGTADAGKVHITDVTLPGATLLSPTSFPVGLGKMVPEGRYPFEADFDATGLTPGTSYPLTLQGAYQLNGATVDFTLTVPVVLPPASPGSAQSLTGSAVSNSDLGPFPHQSHGFDADVNEPRPPVPIAPPVSGIPTPQSTGLGQTPGATADGDSFRSQSVTPDSAVSFLANHAVDVKPADIWGITEPSGASDGQTVFVTYNSTGNGGAAYSTNGGASFTELDPTTIFPNDGIGFCCDQWVQYVPSIDRFVWILQGLSVENGGEGGYRLSEIEPSRLVSMKGHGWTHWNLTPAVFKQPTKTDFDFPSVSVGDNDLYLSWDIGFPACGTKTAPCNAGREVVRIPLTQIQAGGTINFRYTDPSTGPAWADLLTQDTGDEVFWAGHNGTSALRVFSWAESSTSYSWRDVPIATYTPNPDGATNKAGVIVPSIGHVASTAPNPVSDPPEPVTQDWLFRGADDSIVGATRAGSHIWFAWNAAPDENFPQPYVQLVAINTSNGFAVKQHQIWNSSFAFAMPALATDACTGEIGLSVGVGGGGSLYPNHTVGFWGDYLVYPSTAGNVTTGLYGDYSTIRQNNTATNHGAYFDSFGYALDKAPGAGSGSVLPQSQVDIDIRYVVFGRGGMCLTK